MHRRSQFQLVADLAAVPFAADAGWSGECDFPHALPGAEPPMHLHCVRRLLDAGAVAAEA
jgi:hypothetical protein